MNINETIAFFKSLLKKTDRKSEIKIYKNFVGILTNLESRELNQEQLRLIEEELESFALKSNPKNKKRYFGKRLSEFEKYLKEEFSLITEGFYTAMGMSLGISFGIPIGLSFGSIGVGLGIAFGMLIGLIIGRIKDEKAERQNQVLRTKFS